MKIATHSLCINSPFPVKQYGFIDQTEEITEVHDDLHARIVAIDDGEGIHIHVSCDLIGLPYQFQESLYNRLKNETNRLLSLTIGTTHTHFGPTPHNEKYLSFLQDALFNQINSLEYIGYSNLKVSYHCEQFEGVGKSRISNHKANVLLQLLTIYNEGKPLVVFMIHNCHPTIMAGSTPYFSSEYPGLSIEKLSHIFPDTFFTFIQGAAGDVSTRFTRETQTYDAVESLASCFVNEVSRLLSKKADKIKLDEICYKAEKLSFTHDTKPLVFDVPSDLSERELVTIEVGKVMRQRLLSKPENLVKEVTISCLSFNQFKIVFAPNEMFSYYIDAIDTTDTALACYSNGYSPYVTAIDNQVITYEKFTDTLTKETKESLYSTIHRISR